MMQLFSKESWKAVVFAFAIVIMGQLLLAWQYYQIEQRRLPQIEKDLQQQQDIEEARQAQEALSLFLQARIEQNEPALAQLMSERVQVQQAAGVFSLEDQIGSFKIVFSEKMEKERYRFEVELRDLQGRVVSLEIIEMQKILGKYYADSLLPAG